MSGLSRTPGKRVWVNPHRGFESRPLRQEHRKTDPRVRFFVWGSLHRLWGLWGRLSLNVHIAAAATRASQFMPRNWQFVANCWHGVMVC